MGVTSSLLAQRAISFIYNHTFAKYTFQLIFCMPKGLCYYWQSYHEVRTDLTCVQVFLKLVQLHDKIGTEGETVQWRFWNLWLNIEAARTEDWTQT